MNNKTQLARDQGHDLQAFRLAYCANSGLFGDVVGALRMSNLPKQKAELQMHATQHFPILPDYLAKTKATRFHATLFGAYVGIGRNASLING